MTNTLHPFWSDDFDSDLLKVIPNVLEDLGEDADIPLWTVGHTYNGRLNHPTRWNSHGAFVWLAKPHLERDDGWFNIGGCIDDAPEVECTWLELLRDQWVHSYDFMLMTPSRPIFSAFPYEHFSVLLYHVRNWHLNTAGAAEARTVGSMWVGEATRRLKQYLANARPFLTAK